MSEVRAPSLNPRRRKRALWFVAVPLVLLAGALGLYWQFVWRYQASTDDAYVAGYLTQVDARTSGTVSAVYVHDTDTVRAGDLLVRLDPTDAQLALARLPASAACVIVTARSG